MADKKIPDMKPTEKLMNPRTIATLKAIAAIHEKEGHKRGLTGTIECPMCKGTLHYSIAKYNGHVWGRCETERCLSWMQ